jgi:predicted HAD superfamily phosphohydrolase
MTSLPGEKPTRWRATYTDGRTCNFVVLEEDAPRRYAERISDTNVPFAGAWNLELERRELTTQVTAHSRVELHRPLDRLFVRLFVKPEVEVEKILNGLKRRVEGSTVNPTPATS